jgi:tetrahydromethanopterin S-methyltransferase subunit G
MRGGIDNSASDFQLVGRWIGVDLGNTVYGTVVKVIFM